MGQDTIKVAITARLRNGLLWEAVKKAGSQAALARHLGVSPTTLGAWLNFKVTPSYDNANHKPRREELDSKLFELTGATFDEVFPHELRSEQFKSRHKQIDQTVDMSMEQLLGTGAVPHLPPAPDEIVFQRETKDIIQEQLKTLPPRERKVLEMRFGLNGQEEYTLEEIGTRFRVTRDRIRQIEVRALRRLRHPSRSRELEQIVLEPSELRSREIERRRKAQAIAEERQRNAESERLRKYELWQQSLRENAERLQRQREDEYRASRSYQKLCQAVESQMLHMERLRSLVVEEANGRGARFVRSLLSGTGASDIPQRWLQASTWMNGRRSRGLFGVPAPVEGETFSARPNQCVTRLMYVREMRPELKALIRMVSHPDSQTLVRANLSGPVQMAGANL